MKKFLLTIVYATLCYLPLLFLKQALDIGDSWWIDLLLIGFSYFTGSFIFTQFHGNQVTGLFHLGSHRDTHKFQVTIRVSGLGLLNLVGHYLRIEQYSDLVLQGKIFKTVNSFPGNKWIKDFANNRNEKVINISIADYDLPHPLNFTQITLEKCEEESTGNSLSGLKTRAELEKEFDGLSNY